MKQNAMLTGLCGLHRRIVQNIKLSDPFDRSVALVLSLVKEEGMDPWNIDLSAFLKLFTQRVRKESSWP